MYKLKRTIGIVKIKKFRDPGIYGRNHIQIVFSCNIKNLCVNILYRFIFHGIPSHSKRKTSFQAADTQRIKRDGIVAE